MTGSVTVEQRNAILEQALRAPSGDNCQPWRLDVVSEGAVDLWFDAPRARAFLDHRGIASRLSLGAFLESARLAGASRGIAVDWTLDPLPTEPFLWARITLGGPSPATDDLASFLEARCSNRNPYDGSALQPAEEAALRSEARDPVGVHVLSTPAKLADVAELVGIAERVRAETRVAHEELHRWLRWTPEHAETTGDGLDVRTLGLTPFETRALRLLGPWSRMRLGIRLGVGKANGNYSRRLVAKSSGVVLLTVEALSPSATTAAGVVLQRVWLRATQRGLAFSPIASLVLLMRVESDGGFPSDHAARIRKAGEELAERFDLKPGIIPLFLARIGHAHAPGIRSFRRSLDAVLSTAR